MSPCRIIIEGVGIGDRISVSINILSSSDLGVISIVATAFDFPVASRENASFGRLVVALVVLEKRLSVRRETFAWVLHDFVKRVITVEVEHAEVDLALLLPNILVGLDEIDVEPLRSYRTVSVSMVLCHCEDNKRDGG